MSVKHGTGHIVHFIIPFDYLDALDNNTSEDDVGTVTVTLLKSMIELCVFCGQTQDQPS